MNSCSTCAERGIMDAAVLRAMEEVPRDKSSMPAHARSAYLDRAMPIACGQTISQPFVVAYMTSSWRCPAHHVLEVGYRLRLSTRDPVAARRRVTSIERYRTLADGARIRLRR